MLLGREPGGMRLWWQTGVNDMSSSLGGKRPSQSWVRAVHGSGYQSCSVSDVLLLLPPAFLSDSGSSCSCSNALSSIAWLARDTAPIGLQAIAAFLAFPVFTVSSCQKEEEAGKHVAAVAQQCFNDNVAWFITLVATPAGRSRPSLPPWAPSQLYRPSGPSQHGVECVERPSNERSFKFNYSTLLLPMSANVRWLLLLY